MMFPGLDERMCCTFGCFFSRASLTWLLSLLLFWWYSACESARFLGFTIAHVTLMVTDSIAIWNKNKYIVALAGSVWGANVSFLLQGKSLSICARHKT